MAQQISNHEMLERFVQLAEEDYVRAAYQERVARKNGATGLRLAGLEIQTSIAWTVLVAARDELEQHDQEVQS